MRYDGIDCIGEFKIERVSSLPSWSSLYEGRMAYTEDTDRLYIGISSAWRLLAKTTDDVDLTATAAEINTACDGVLATAAEINTACDGSTAKNSHVHTESAFMLTKGSSQDNIATGSEVTVVWGSENFDVGSDFVSNAFTVPTNGYYQLCVAVTLENLDTASSTYRLSITVDGSPTLHNAIDLSTGISADFQKVTLTVSGLMILTSGQVVTTTVIQQGGTSQTDITSGHFSGFLVA